MKIEQRDWILFKDRLPIWQNKHIESLVDQYLEILTDGSSAPADKFWQLEKRIREDKKNPGVIVEMSRDNVIGTIVSLLRDETIAWDDLDGFSDTLRERIRFFVEE